MSKQKESKEYSLFGDFDGLLVDEMIELFEELRDEYGGDARVDVRSEKEYGFCDQGSTEREFFVVQKAEE